MKTKSTRSNPRPASQAGLQNRNEQVRTDKSIGIETAIGTGTDNASDSAPCKPVQQTTGTTPIGRPSLGWRGVFFDGPEPELDKRQDEEIPVWTVFVGDKEANPHSRVYRVFSFAKAEALAHAMSRDRRLELIAEAQPA